MSGNLFGNLLGWLILLGVGVPFSIALHELGHLLPAKRFGVACPQYFIGFGPKVWSTRRGGTEYGIKAIPLGGYVRMMGMFPPAPGRPVSADSTGRFGVLIDRARAEAQREISPRDADRLFYQRSVPQRLVIMLGGPFMNLLLAVVLMTGVLTLYGASTLTTTVGSISQCVLPVPVSKTTPSRGCLPTDQKSPAELAGLRAGDEVISYAGRPVESWRELRDRIRASNATPIEVVVRRNGAPVTLTVTPMVSARYVYDENDNPVTGPNGEYLTTPTGFLGMTPLDTVEPVPVAKVPGVIGGYLAVTFSAITKVPEKMVGVVQAAFGDGPRDPEGPVSVVGVGRIAGEVGSFQGTDEAPVRWVDKIAIWVNLIASLNLALFVFNLVPLLPLDGGHVVGALWEGLRRQVARVFGRPDPGPVDIARALPLAYAVGSVLITMSVLLIYADIVKPIRLGG